MKTIWLNLPATERQDKLNLSTSSPEVQEALQTIGAAVIPNGLIQDPNLPMNEAGLIAYFHNDFSISYCKVYLKEDALTVALFEAGKGHGSVDFRKMCSSLEKDLIIHYSAKRVKVDW